jgi:PKD repeat protein
LPARQTFEGVRETFAAVAFDPEGRDLVYTWSFGDGSTQEGRIAHHAFGSAGNYTVEVTVSDGQQASTVSGIVTVLPFSGTVMGGQSDGRSTVTDNTMLYVGAGAAVAAALGLVVLFAFRRRGSAPDGRGEPAPKSELGPTEPAERPPPRRAPRAPPGSPPSQFDYYQHAYGGQPPAKGPGRQPPRSPGERRGP